MYATQEMFFFLRGRVCHRYTYLDLSFDLEMRQPDIFLPTFHKQVS